ncbi:hypothetical protein BT63DRAFT_365991 [Microthyrium microscopicum]|uniref:Zn(2)-C6 fungal-type domain-containing protein n=1 Tax=Microthyrium microscopicum TaxID=703497 RepID=A0A6A6UV60_9PEZI|nr:hypothetical protein BT63DRAFT_365991 [Microthyrium microscopicum]
MFHRFPATPAKSRGSGSGSARSKASRKNSNAHTTSISNSNSSPEHTVLPLSKRHKTARACDRCRLHRIKCDEQKPCANCVGIQAKCIVPSTSPSPSPTRSTEHAGSPNCPQSINDSSGCNSASNSSSIASISPNSSSTVPSGMTMDQENWWATVLPPESNHKEPFNLASHAQSFFASGLPAFSHSSTSTLSGSLFAQLPHPAIPSEGRFLASNPLSQSQRSYYLRIFWDACHPFLQIISESEFVELDTLPPPAMFDGYMNGSPLADSMIALGMQHSHATGMATRILGLQPSTQQYSALASPVEATWPGLEYFHRCRQRMRTNTDVTLEALRCHALMALYLMKGNAFREAYNLLGITVRKAYIAKLHRPPASHLSEAERTAHMQLWWMLFSLDIQCSLQLDMPAASQKSLIRCPFPAEDALARYVSSASHREEGVNACTYSNHLAKLAVIVSDLGACASTADLVDDGGSSPVAIEHHALDISSALGDLEVWHDQLPPELLLSRAGNASDNSESLEFGRDLTKPAWLQRQAVLLELHFHNVYTLIQRPFIRLRYPNAGDNCGMITPPDSKQPHVEVHISSALHHAIIIVDTAHTVCSVSDVLFGWSEILQPLWNATVTIMAYIHSDNLGSKVPRALESLTRAQAVFESFSSTSIAAKDISQSLTNNLQSMMAQPPCTVVNNDPMNWDVFGSMLEEQQTSPTVLSSVPSSDDLYSGSLISPFLTSSSHINTPDLHAMTMGFGDS